MYVLLSYIYNFFLNRDLAHIYIIFISSVNSNLEPPDRQHFHSSPYSHVLHLVQYYLVVELAMGMRKG
jgi:hypothetical protein